MNSICVGSSDTEVSLPKTVSITVVFTICVGASDWMIQLFGKFVKKQTFGNRSDG